jgi:hypothetical protein
MTIRIEGRDYTLSQRRAVDVLDLSAVVQKEGEPDAMMNLLRMAQVVCDSLKATALQLGRIRGYRYRRFVGKGGVQALIESLSLQEISDACERVAEAEGLKKKAT